MSNSARQNFKKSVGEARPGGGLASLLATELAVLDKIGLCHSMVAGDVGGEAASLPCLL